MGNISNMHKLLAILLTSSLCSTPFAWTITLDFDDGELGTRADNGGDGFNGEGSATLYSNTQKLKGNSASVTIQEGDHGFGKWGGSIIYPEVLRKGDTLWFQMHAYYPEGYDNYSYGEGGRLKFFRIHTAQSNGDHCCYNDLLWLGPNDPEPLAFSFEGQGGYSYVGNQNDQITFNTWESYQVVTTFDSVAVDNGGLARIRIYKNDQLLADITDTQTLDADNHYADFTFLYTYWNGMAPKTQTMWVDEITLTNEPPETTDPFGFPMLKSLIQVQPDFDVPLQD